MVSSIYSVSEVLLTNEGFAFKLIGVVGKPLINFGFGTRSEAEAARQSMLEVVATAKVIEPISAN